MRRKVKQAEQPKRIRKIELLNEDGLLVGIYDTLDKVAEKIGVAVNAVGRALSGTGKIKTYNVSYLRQGIEFVRQNPSASMAIPRGLSGTDLENFKRSKS